MNAKKTALRPCPICSKNQVKVLHAMRFHLSAGMPLPSAYDIVHCPRCDFVYADTPGSQTDYDRYYADFSRYEDAATASGGADNKEDALRLEETAFWLKKHLRAGMRVVDMGCGNGGLLKAISHHVTPPYLSGIDPAPRCVQRLNAEGFSAHQGYLGRLPENCGSYDFVILSHVLEHVIDLAGALLTVRQLLSPNGKIYVETPDASRYPLEDFPPFYFFDPEHINHFDHKSLIALGATQGFHALDRVEKTLVLPKTRHYPAVGVLFEFTGQIVSSSSARAQDKTLGEKISAYIAASRQKLHEAETRLAAAILNRPVALWGAGSLAQRQLENSVLKQANIVAVLDRDSNKQGKLFAGCTVQAPEEGLRHLPENTLLIIAAAIHAEAIRDEIAAIDANLPCFIL